MMKIFQHFSTLLFCFCLIGSSGLFAQSFTSQFGSGNIIIPNQGPIKQIKQIKDTNNAAETAVTTYNNRGDFHTACGSPLTLEDFDGSGTPPFGVHGGGAPSNNANGNGLFPNGELQPGMELDFIGSRIGCPIECPLVVLGTGLLGNPSPGVAANFFIDQTVVNFPDDNVRSLGFDYINAGGPNLNISLYDVNDQLIQTYPVASPGFFGAISDYVISKVVLHDPAGGGEVLWQLEFGDCNPDPCANDTEKPTISCASNFSQDTDTGVCDASVTIANPTYSDNCGIDKVEFRYREVDGSNNPIGPWSSWMDESNNTQTFDEGRWKIRWRATDTSNNKKGCNHFLDLEDNESPNPLCMNATVSLSGGSGSISVYDVDAGSSDNCGIFDMWVSETSFDCTDLGSFSVTLTVEDYAGNIESCTADVTVNSGSVLTANDVSNNEGTGTGFTFNFVQINRTGDNTCLLTANWNTSDGTATLADNDYVNGSGIHFWPPNNSTNRYSITRTVKDSNVESDESYNVELSASAVVTNAEVTAVNDDGAPLIGNDGNQHINANYESKSIEICDGKDNDGNGLIDEGLDAEIYRGHITLRNQTEVNNFPPCVAALDGNLHIEGLDITDLSPLSNLQVIGGTLTIQNTGLKTLNELEMLNTVALDIEISNNPKMTYLNDFAENVSTFGEIHIQLESEGTMSKYGINIFPNPASEVVNIQFDNLEETTTLVIYNTLGKIVLQREILEGSSNFTLATTNLARGIYLISTQVNGQELTEKLILK